MQSIPGRWLQRLSSQVPIKDNKIEHSQYTYTYHYALIFLGVAPTPLRFNKCIFNNTMKFKLD